MEREREGERGREREIERERERHCLFCKFVYYSNDFFFLQLVATLLQFVVGYHQTNYC